VSTRAALESKSQVDLASIPGGIRGSYRVCGRSGPIHSARGSARCVWRVAASDLEVDKPRAVQAAFIVRPIFLSCFDWVRSLGLNRALPESASPIKPVPPGRIEALSLLGPQHSILTPALTD
jgi:hypothetical protein